MIPNSGSPSRSAGRRATGLPAVPGVVETIANGLSLVLVYPALIAIPLLADALVWIGLRVSPQALVAESASTADVLESLGLESDLLRLGSLFVPSLLTWVDRDALFTSGDGGALVLGSWWSVSLAIVAIVLVGALVYAAFRVPLAYVVRRQTLRPLAVGRSVVLAWLRLLGLAALVAAVTALMIFPLAVAGGLLYLVGVNAAPLLTAAVAVPGVVALVYLYFAPVAIAVSEVGPFRACYLSFNVVRRNFWPVLGLIGSILLISSGLPVLWLSRADHPIGLLIGVFCHALVSTGLVLASMQFYTDRLGRWQRSLHGPSARVARV
jgi:hypothetical protein